MPSWRNVSERLVWAMSNAKRMLGQVINEQQIKKELGEKYRGTYLRCCTPMKNILG